MCCCWIFILYTSFPKHRPNFFIFQFLNPSDLFHHFFLTCCCFFCEGLSKWWTSTVVSWQHRRRKRGSFYFQYDVFLRHKMWTNLPQHLHHVFFLIARRSRSKFFFGGVQWLVSSPMLVVLCFNDWNVGIAGWSTSCFSIPAWSCDSYIYIYNIYNYSDS